MTCVAVAPPNASLSRLAFRRGLLTCQSQLLGGFFRRLRQTPLNSKNASYCVFLRLINRKKEAFRDLLLDAFELHQCVNFCAIEKSCCHFGVGSDAEVARISRY